MNTYALVALIVLRNMNTFQGSFQLRCGYRTTTEYLLLNEYKRSKVVVNFIQHSFTSYRRAIGCLYNASVYESREQIKAFERVSKMLCGNCLDFLKMPVLLYQMLTIILLLFGIAAMFLYTFLKEESEHKIHLGLRAQVHTHHFEMANRKYKVIQDGLNNTVELSEDISCDNKPANIKPAKGITSKFRCKKILKYYILRRNLMNPSLLQFKYNQNSNLNKSGAGDRPSSTSMASRFTVQREQERGSIAKRLRSSNRP